MELAELGARKRVGEGGASLAVRLAALRSMPVCPMFTGVPCTAHCVTRAPRTYQARLISALSPLDFDKDLSLHAGFKGRQWIMDELGAWMEGPVGTGEQFRW